jgi:hypothetical protein
LHLGRHYTFEFAHSIEILWTIVSDMPRWGEASGLPRYQVSEELQSDRVRRREVALKGYTDPVTIAQIKP